MSVQIKSGASGDILVIDPSKNAARVANYPPEALGHYRLAATSGLLTTIAAGSASAGHLFAFRNAGSNLAIITSLIVKWRTIAGFTAAQEMALKTFLLSAYSASHSGGTDIPLTTPQFKKRQSYPVTTVASARIGTTGALTAGTHTLNTNEFLSDSFAELAAAATVPKGQMTMTFRAVESNEHGLVMANNEGFIVRNEVLMGAGGTGRLIVEMDWFEVAAW